MEAMAVEIPVLAHDGPIFRWVIGNDMSLIDMSAEVQLDQHIKSIATNETLRLAMIEKNYANVLERFEWSSLKNAYIEMYQKAMQTAI